MGCYPANEVEGVWWDESEMLRQGQDDAAVVANYQSEKAADGPAIGALGKADELTTLISDDACWFKWKRLESPEG